MVRAKKGCHFLELTTGLLLLFMNSAGCGASRREVKKETDVGINAAAKIASVVIEKSKNLPHKTVAIVEFYSIEGDECIQGKLLAERIITEVVKDDSLSVVERSQVERILKEQKFEFSGVVNPETAKNMGKILGVDAIVCGTIIELDEINEINARMVDVEKGIILSAITVREKLTVLKSEAYEKMKNLHPNEAKQIEEEYKTRGRLKKENPQEFEKIITSRKRLARLKREKPLLFQKMVVTKRTLLYLAKEKPRKFILLTKPDPPQRLLRRLRRNKPQLLTEINRIRTGMKLLREHLPDDFLKILKIRKRLIRKYGRGW